MLKKTTLAAAAFCVLAAPSAHAASEPINVTVTIRPVHALVKRLMQGAGEPRLLITGGASPHSYALKPSDARALANSDLIVRVSPSLEVPLNASLKNLPKDAKMVSLHETPGLSLLGLREGGVWEAHDHGASNGHDHDHDHMHSHAGHDHAHDDQKHSHDHDHAHDAEAGHADGDHDSHFWLDPRNARAMVRHLADALGELRPEQKPLFEANAATLEKDLEALDAELNAMTEPVKAKPFIVFHDAYQYFEKRYGLNAAGSVTVSPDRQPSARRIRDLRARIGESNAACVFAEPQFEPRLVGTIVEGSGAQTGVLDPEGTGMADGADGYFDLMRALGRNLAECLSRADG